MYSSKFRDLLSLNLESLSDDRIVDFALNVCRRLLPDYNHFYDKYNWGNLELLKDVLNKIEERALTNDEIKEFIVEVDKVIPDTEEFGDYSGSYALNASASVLELLEFLIDTNQEHIVSISTYSTDTIDFKLYEIDQSLSDTDLLHHPVLLQEQKRQLEFTRNRFG
jgi:uncharacterized protein YjaG (DUF416 family)